MGRYTNELINIIKRYRLDFRSTRWKQHLFMAENGLYSESVCKMLLYQARHDAKEVEDKGNFLWRPPDESELYAEGIPDIELGTLIEADPLLRCGIRFKDRPRNLLVIGGAGGGKSVLCRKICVEVDLLNYLHPNKKPTFLIIIDPKPDYLDFKFKLKGKVKIYSPHHNLKIGLNGPPDVPPSVWIGQLTMSIAARIGLVVSRTCLAAIIMRLLVSLNPGLHIKDLEDASVAKDLKWPPLKVVLEIAKKKEILEVYSSKGDYGKTLIQALDGLLYDSGSLFDCCNGLDINKEIIEAKSHCVFNVSNTPSYITHLITDIAINQVLVRKLYLNYKCDHTDEIFLIDECDLLVESDVAHFPDGMSPLDKLHRLGRELGLMSIVSISGI